MGDKDNIVFLFAMDVYTICKHMYMQRCIHTHAAYSILCVNLVIDGQSLLDVRRRDKVVLRLHLTPLLWNKTADIINNVTVRGDPQ